jgi:hypothetical protein
MRALEEEICTPSAPHTAHSLPLQMATADGAMTPPHFLSALVSEWPQLVPAPRRNATHQIPALTSENVTLVGMLFYLHQRQQIHTRYPEGA